MIGITLAIMAGFCWALVGIIFSFIARKEVNYFAFIGFSAFVKMLIAWVIFPNYGIILDGAVENLGPLVVIMTTSGILNSIGITTMNRAMKKGHHGIIWAIAQSALLVPFLAGIVIFDSFVSSRKIIGIFFTLCALLLLGRAKTTTTCEDMKKQSAGVAWILLAFISMLFLGLHQTLTTIPSYWYNWTDTGNLRPPLIFSGVAIGYAVPAFINRYSIGKETLKFSLLLILVSMPAQPLLYKSMDLLAPCGLIPIIYPVAVSTTIITFSLYSLLVLKEHASSGYIAGVLCGIIGFLFITI